MRLLYGYYDCENLIARRAGRASFNELGNIAAEELEAELADPQQLPARMARVVKAFALSQEELSEENE